MTKTNGTTGLRIGWAETDISPQQLPVYIAGQFHARVSEGIKDPLKSTALALEEGGEHVVFVSVDTVSIPDPLRDAVRAQLQEAGLDPLKVILHATHTHAAPLNRVTANGSYQRWHAEDEGFDLNIVPAEEYVDFAAERITKMISQAWQNRAPGGVAYGQDYAVVGRNRRWVSQDGVATIYGLNEKSADRFGYIEGYEDHSLNLLATYDDADNLTGVVVNLPSPSQEDEQLFELSADFWCETRQELRERFGKKLFILPQVSAAGDLTSHLIFEKAAHERMLELRGRTARQEVAVRIADAVGRVLPYLPATIDRCPPLEHHHQTLQLPLNKLTEADAEDARTSVEKLQEEYEVEKRKILENPELQNEPRWYVPLTRCFNRAGWFHGVIERFESQNTQPTYPAEVHVLRLGEIAFASNPFEYYLDFGIQIKVQSPAMQTFLVQLAGNGTYVPSRRAAAGGGYGAVPASNPVGPEGGEELAARTVEQLRDLFYGMRCGGR